MAGNKEVLFGTETVLSCVVTGLLAQLDTVTWEDGTAKSITNSMTDYEVDEGSYDAEKRTQTTTLTVKDGVNTRDSVYKCVLTRGEKTRKTAVNLKIFSKLLSYTYSVKQLPF